jgi:hypothetical protein
LEEEAQIKISREAKTQEDVDLILEKLRTEKIKTEVDFYAEKITKVAGLLNSVLTPIFDGLKAKDEAELKNFEKSSERKKKSNDRLLKNNLISREEFEKKNDEIDRKVDEKQRQIAIKQFNRRKVLDLVAIASSTAKSVAEAYATPPAPNFTLAGIALGLGLAQAAIVATQKPPQLGEGGKLYGPSHSSKSHGIPAIDPVSGRVQLLLEGEEGVIKKNAMRSNRVYNVTGTVSQIASTLNGTYGGTTWDKSATITPMFSRGGLLPRINYRAAMESIQRVTHYENGGSIPNINVSSNNEMIALIDENVKAIKELGEQIAGGIYAITSLSRLKNDQRRSDELKRNVTLR